MGLKFTVITDQRALKHLLEQREIQSKYQKWLTKLLGYDFEIKYNPGLLNKVADTLSRVPHEVELASISIPSIIDLDLVQREVDKDTEFIKIRQDLEQDPLSHPKFSVEQGKLLYKDKVMLSGKSSLIPTLLQTFHNSVMGGHSSFLRTYERITEELYWRNMKNDVKQYVEKCLVCRRNKSNSVSPVYFNHCLFRIESEKTYPWISSKDYPSPRDSMQFSWW